MVSRAAARQRITDPDSIADERFGDGARAGSARHANFFSGRKFRVDHPHARLRARRSALGGPLLRRRRANNVVEKRLCHADFARHLRRSPRRDGATRASVRPIAAAMRAELQERRSHPLFIKRSRFFLVVL